MACDTETKESTKVWQTHENHILSINDEIFRLAKFVRGDDHLTEEEVEAYEVYESEGFESLLQSSREDTEDVVD
jgi:hypothetical protein